MSRPKVLIMSESPFHLMLMGDLLDANDLMTVRAHSATQGIEALRRERPDLAVVDLEMSHLHQKRFLDACRASGESGETPVVLVAASNQRDEAENLLSHLSGRAVLKPIDTGRFPRAVLHEIRRPTREGERLALL